MVTSFVGISGDETLRPAEVWHLKALFELLLDEAVADNFGDEARWCWDIRCSWRCLITPGMPHVYLMVRMRPEDKDERRVLILRTGLSFYVSEEDIYAP